MKIKSIIESNCNEVSSKILKLEYISDIDCLNDWAYIWPCTKTKKWIICIHGHGSHGDQLYVRQDIRESWLNPLRRLNFNFLTPNLRDNGWMSPNVVEDMHELINFLRDCYDAEEFIFFSGSMGGTSNLIYSLLHPEDVTMVVALGAASDLSSYYYWCVKKKEVNILQDIANSIRLSYDGDPEQNPLIYERHSVLINNTNFKVPLFLAHGTADSIIPVEQSRKLAEKLANLPRFQYHEVSDGNHDSPLYLADKAINWLTA